MDSFSPTRQYTAESIYNEVIHHGTLHASVRCSNIFGARELNLVDLGNLNLTVETWNLEYFGMRNKEQADVETPNVSIQSCSLF